MSDPAKLHGGIMYGRDPKESDRDTITYEIDMLDFCMTKLIDKHNASPLKDENIYIEAFLVHYRNLICFFSGKHHRCSSDLDTSSPEVWAMRSLSQQERTVIQEIQAQAGVLDRDFKPVSQYVQHCTTIRAARERGWDLEGMYRSIDAIISTFEKTFPRQEGKPRVKCPLPTHRPDGVFRTGSY